MDVSKYIHEFLNERGEIGLPGLGWFGSTFKPPAFNESGSTLSPPGKQYTFDPERKETNDDFIRFIAGKENIPLSMAEKEVEEYVEGCHFVIGRGKRLEITGVGLLYANPQGEITYEQDAALSTSGEFFGLPEIPVKILRKRNFSSLLKLGLALLIIGVLVMGGFYAQMISQFLRKSFFHKEHQQPQNQRITKDTLQFARPDTLRTLTTEPATDSVIIQVIPAEKQIPMHPKVRKDSTRQFYVVAGCFRLEEGAKTMVKELRDKGFDAKIFGKNKQGLNMVCYQSFSSREEAKSGLEKIMKEADPKAWLIRY